MKLDNNKIIEAARRQRELDNASLNVSNWTSPKHHFSLPLNNTSWNAWLVALPAATIAGFVIGLFARQLSTNASSQLTAHADTVYVVKEVPVAQAPDTVVRYVSINSRTSTTQQTGSEFATTPASPPLNDNDNIAEWSSDSPVAGKSIDEDGIDYSLLVLN